MKMLYTIGSRLKGMNTLKDSKSRKTGHLYRYVETDIKTGNCLTLLLPKSPLCTQENSAVKAQTPPCKGGV